VRADRVARPRVVELPPGVGPAPDLRWARGRAVEQRVVLLQGVGLDVPGVAAQPGPRAIAGVGGGEVEHRVRVLGIAEVHPQVTRSGPLGARVEDRDRGVVRLDHPGLPHQLGHPVDERLQQVGRGGDPAPEGGRGEVHPVPGEDAVLAVQRQVIGELRYDDVGEQAGSGEPLVDRLGRERGGRDRWGRVVGRVGGPTTRGAGVGVPHPLDDEQGRRPVVELFARLGPDPDPKDAAARARLLGLGQVDLDPLPGEVVGQRSPTVPAPPTGRLIDRRGRGCRRRLGRCRAAARDPLGLAAVQPSGQVVDPVLLGLDRFAEVGDGDEQFPDHPVEGGHVGRQWRARRVLHAPFNTAGPNR
jgi:hypothetical protein